MAIASHRQCSDEIYADASPRTRRDLQRHQQTSRSLISRLVDLTRCAMLSEMLDGGMHARPSKSASKKLLSLSKTTMASKH